MQVAVLVEVPERACAVQPEIGDPPSKNSTLPVASAELDEVGVTVAVYVTGWPTTDGVPVDATAILDVE
jgi:hypothetical protein